MIGARLRQIRIGGVLPPGLSAAVFATAALMTVAGSLTGIEGLTRAAGLCLAAFVLLEFRAVKPPQQIAALVLLAIAAAVALRDGALFETLLRGLERTLPFLLIFASIGWLRSAAMQSPAVHSIGVTLPRLAPGRRFAAMAVTAHLIGSAFNLAGIGLLAPMVDGEQLGPENERRLRCAILWGFAAAPCWSPFIVGTVAILSVFDGLGWTEALPYGLALAALFLLWAALWNRLSRGPAEGSASSAELDELAAPAARMLGVLAALFLLVFGLMEAGGVALTIAIALVAPVFALVWVQRAGSGEKGARFARAVVAGYPGMRGETTLFAAANIFGTAVSAALAGGEGANGAPAALTGVFYLDCLLMLWGFLAVSAAGLHPVVSLVIFAALVEPQSLGVPVPLLAAVMMALWGVGTSVSPLSGTTLLMSQLSGVSSFRIAWRWSGAFYALSCLWLALFVTLLR